MSTNPDPNAVPSEMRETQEFAPSDPPATLISSEELMQGRRELLIMHCQEVYRLRLTRNGKLILTK
jgi:hemin uptake protein HemP